MEQRNSYFQMELKPEGAYVKIFPPKEGGQFIRVNELSTYLNNRGYKKVDIKALNQAAFSNQEALVLVGENDGIAVNESMNIDISQDGMKVTCRFFPPSKGGDLLNAAEIIRDLQYHGIRVGINQDRILLFLQERAYCTDIVLAEGQAPVPGHDADIVYHFKTDVTLKPKHNADGSVDYHQLSTISHVRKGDLLATLIPEDPGKPGMDVCGKEIKPPTVKKKTLLFGNHITLSEDKTEIYSDVTGHATLVDGKVFVSDIYEVPADVDNSTGNIDYEGNVLVRGNVKGGFTIHADGDIIVEGVVEDAILRSGGQIIVQRGIHGMTKGALVAEGNVVCKFIESATVESGGYIETESILHSQVSATTEIHVRGRKGFITGGVIRAGSLVEADTIGSDMGSATRIEVGMDPTRRERYNWVQKALLQSSRDIDQVKPVLKTYNQKLNEGEQLPPQKILYIQQLAAILKTKQQEHAQLKAEYDKLHLEVTQSNDARVKVHKSIYPGVTVSISEISLTLKTDRSYCQLLKRDGAVVIDTL